MNPICYRNICPIEEGFETLAFFMEMMYLVFSNSNYFFFFQFVMIPLYFFVLLLLLSVQDTGPHLSLEICNICIISVIPYTRRSQAPFQIRGTYLGCGFDVLSHTDVSLSLPLPLFLKSIRISSGEDLKRKKINLLSRCSYIKKNPIFYHLSTSRMENINFAMQNEEIGELPPTLHTLWSVQISVILK